MTTVMIYFFFCLRSDERNLTITLFTCLTVIFRVYCADHTYCTLRQPVNATAETIKLNAADKLGLRHEELVLAEIKSNGTLQFRFFCFEGLFDKFFC